MSEAKTSLKVALLNSPYVLNEAFFQHMPPMSLLYLGGYIEKQGHTPKLFTIELQGQGKGYYFFGYNLEALYKELKAFSPDCIGITCPYSARWPFLLHLSRILRKWFPETPLVTGGIHPTTFPEECIESGLFDAIILGEGELSFSQYLAVLGKEGCLDDIDGIVFKKNNKVVINQKTSFAKDLDSFPFPAYHLLDMEKQKELCRNDRISLFKGLYFSILTSRSCPNQCTYCNMFLAHGRKWRPRSPQNVLKEIEYLVKTYNIRQFAIVDDNFSFSRKRAKEILKGIIELNLGISFITPNGLSLKALDDELVFLLKKAGAMEISIAIESGSEFIRNKVYRKIIKNDQIYSIVNSCKKHGLPCRAFFMVGAPGESDETVNESIKMIRKIKIPVYINITTPYKGTELFNIFASYHNLGESDLRSDGVDIRLPLSKLKNAEQILNWRRKMQMVNAITAWDKIIFSKSFFNFNVFKRLWQGVLFPQCFDREDIQKVLHQYMPFEDS